MEFFTSLLQGPKIGQELAKSFMLSGLYDIYNGLTVFVFDV